MTPQTLQLVFIGVAAVALAIQTIFLIVTVFIALKAIRTVKEELAEYRSSIMPIIDKTRELVQQLTPKIDQISTKVHEASADLTVIVKSLRKQTEDIKVAAEDIIERTRKQANRVDGMLTTILDRVERAGVFVAEAVAKPMRQLSGLIASVKAAVETLREPETGRVPPRRTTSSRMEGNGEHLSPRPTAPSPFRP